MTMEPRNSSGNALSVAGDAYWATASVAAGAASTLAVRVEASLWEKETRSG